MRMRNLLLSMFLLMPFYVFGHNIDGSYSVHGYDGISGPYTGTMTITSLDDIYTLNWTFSDSMTSTGTGVRNKNDLSVVWFESDQGYGTQLYKIHHDHLKGPWVTYSDTDSGWEEAKKID